MQATKEAELKEQPSAQRVNWNYGDLGIILGILFVFSIILGQLPEINIDDFSFFVITTLIQTSVLLVAVLFRVKHSGSNLSALGLSFKVKDIQLFSGLWSGIGLAAFAYAAGKVMEYSLSQPPNNQVIAEAIGQAKGFWQLAVLFMVGALITPTVEEIFFRGFTLPLFERHFTNTAAMWLNGLFFGLMHFDPYRLLPLTLAGYYLSWLYRGQKSLYPCILAHILWNGIMTIIVYFS